MPTEIEKYIQIHRGTKSLPSAYTGSGPGAKLVVAFGLLSHWNKLDENGETQKLIEAKIVDVDQKMRMVAPWKIRS